MGEGLTIDLNVLLVEDNHEHRLITELALARDPGIFCYGVASADAALAWADKPNFAIDVVLSDYLLSNSCGADLLRQLRVLPATRAATMLLMTGMVPPCGGDDKRFADAHRVILKPFDAIMLPRRIREIHELRAAGRLVANGRRADEIASGAGGIRQRLRAIADLE